MEQYKLSYTAGWYTHKHTHTYIHYLEAQVQVGAHGTFQSECDVAATVAAVVALGIV